MRLINADKLRDDILGMPNCYNGFSDTYDKAMIVDMIDEQPTIDAVPVVRCKDCKYSETAGLKISSQKWHLENRDIIFCKYEKPLRIVADIHFCSCGERKDDE